MKRYEIKEVIDEEEVVSINYENEEDFSRDLIKLMLAEKIANKKIFIDEVEVNVVKMSSCVYFRQEFNKNVIRFKVEIPGFNFSCEFES